MLMPNTKSTEVSIGEPKEPSPQSKTKDNVDHVGHSQLPEQLKDTQKYQKEAYNHSQNNN